MVIPTSFQLGGRTWTVEIVEGLKGNNGDDILGLASSASCAIKLDADQSAECMAHTFYHEVMHALCYTIGATKLNRDEDKIDALGGILLQFQQTKKGNVLK